MVLVVGAVGAFLAYAVGGLVGFASSLLMLPVLLVLGVPIAEAVTLNLVLAILTRLPSVVALRAFVDVRRTATMLAGSVPGIGVGLVLVTVVPPTLLEVAAGVCVVLSGLYLVTADRVAARSAVDTGDRAHRSGARGAVLAGACSGALGVTTSLNGVPPAVLLARAGAEVRTRLADLSVFFALGNCLTILALVAVGDLAAPGDPVTTATWLAAGMAGNAAGLWCAQRVDRAAFDSLTVALVLLSGVASLAASAA